MPDADHRYLHGHHESVLRSHRWRTAENSARYLIPSLRPGATVLDVGCGPGTITVGLARFVGAGRVVGIDTAPEVLVEARSGAAALGLDNVAFDVGDVCHLAFGDGAFDVIHAHQVLQHVVNPVAALIEMKRVCRPGGVVAARDGDYGAMFWFPQEPELEEWRTLYQHVARAVGGEPDAGRRMLSWARAAGLTDISVSTSSWCYAAPDERSWWGGLWADRVTQSTFADEAMRRGLADREDLERLGHAWRRWAQSDDACFVIPHVEIVCKR